MEVNNTTSHTCERSSVEHMENRHELLIIWPKNVNADFFEQQYAHTFCKNYIQKSLRKLNISYKLIDHNLIETENITLKTLKYDCILVVRDPMIVISAFVVDMMMRTVRDTYDACGPCLNINNNGPQTAKLLFPVMNTSNYEEMCQIYYNQGKLELEQVQVLDQSCVMYSGKYLINNEWKFLSGLQAPEQPCTKVGRFAVLKNSFVVTFSDSFVSERTDLAELIPKDTRTLLDVGCFYGGLGRILQETKNDIEPDGIEFSDFLAEQSRPYYRKVYHCMFEDFESERNYDAIVCGDVLEHMFDPWKQIKRINNILNHNGCIILSLPNAGHWSFIYDLLQGKFEYIPWGLTCVTHVRWFTEESIIDVLENEGFFIEVFKRIEIDPTREGKDFIQKIIKLGLGNKQSLHTTEFVIRANKK